MEYPSTCPYANHWWDGIYRHQVQVYARLVVTHLKHVLTLFKDVLTQDKVG